MWDNILTASLIVFLASTLFIQHHDYDELHRYVSAAIVVLWLLSVSTALVSVVMMVSGSRG